MEVTGRAPAGEPCQGAEACRVPEDGWHMWEGTMRLSRSRWGNSSGQAQAGQSWAPPVGGGAVHPMGSSAQVPGCPPAS